MMMDSLAVLYDGKLPPESILRSGRQRLGECDRCWPSDEQRGQQAAENRGGEMGVITEEQEKTKQHNQ